MLHKEVPFLRICVPLCAGIVTGLSVKPGFLLIAGAAIIVATLLILSFRAPKYSDNIFFGSALSIALFACGLLLYRNEKDSLSVLEPEQSVFTCELSDYPEMKPGSILLTVKLRSLMDNKGSHHLKGSMLLYIEKSDRVHSFVPGDRLVVRCTPEPLRNRGNPEEFNYRFYMENLGIKYLAFLKTNDLISHEVPVRRKIIHTALITRKNIISMYSRSGITDERLGLVSALTLGEKSNLDPEEKQSFMKAGIMHIMAVSGLHAIILSMFVLNLLFFLKGRLHIIRVLITIMFLWSFAFVTGLTPSVMRATLMFTFLQAGNLMHRRVNGINSVLASAFVLIIAKPSVIFNAGFLLSYSAVVFIIAFYRDLYLKIHPKNRISDWIWQSVAVTLVAQAGTLPLTIMFFNRFPVYFLLTNLIIVPLSSVAIILGCLIPLFFPLNFIASILGLALDQLTGLIMFLTETAASLPYSGIQNIGMTAPECFLLFSLLTALTYYVLAGKKLKLAPLLFLVVLYLAAGTVKDIKIRSTGEIIVYNTRGHPITGIREGRKLNLYSDSVFIPPEVTRHSSTLGLQIRMHVSPADRLISSGGKTIQIGTRQGVNLQKPDYLIINDLKNKNINLNGFKGTVILTGTIRKKPVFLGTVSKDRIHSITESGAYITGL